MTNIVRDWTTWIVPRVNYNSNTNSAIEKRALRTTDLISIRSCKEIKKQTSQYRQRSLTDFALMTSGYQSDCKTQTGKKAGLVGLRTPCSNSHHALVGENGAFSNDSVYYQSFGVCPSLSLKLPSMIPERNMFGAIGEIKEVKSKDGKTLYHTIELGEYPKSKVPLDMREKLEKMYNCGRLCGGLKCTGRLFTTNGNIYAADGFLSRQNPEFELDGERYVRLRPSDYFTSHIYNDGTQVDNGILAEWVKVEPITFRIENYEKLAKGRAKMLELDSDEIILAGLYFYPNEYDANRSMWQNSLIRAFLNSAKTGEMDGNPKYEAPIKFDFKNSGFLYQAFNMTRQPVREYTIPANEKEVCSSAFYGCVGLEKIFIPPHVTKIKDDAFEGCVNSQVFIQLQKDSHLTLYSNAFVGAGFKFVYIAKDYSGLVLSQREDTTLDDRYIKQSFVLQEGIDKFLNENYRENFVQLSTWKQEGAIKFIPPDYTMQTFPSSEMHKYYVNNNNHRWGKLVKTLGFDTLEGDEKKNSLVDLMKIYYAIGGFSDNQGESERAYDYVLKYVATTRKPYESPSQIGQEIHERFSRIDLNGAFNPTFAKFFMKYYRENPNFMVFPYSLGVERDFLCMAHNNFDRIMKAYPNRSVTGNEERALLTPRFIAEHSDVVEYRHVDDGNELLAMIVGNYGYSQEKFERIQRIYNEAKKIKNEHVICADKAQNEDGITFRILEKDDPLGFVLGDITNCCQHIGGAAESCVEDGYINPNAGFLVFEEPELDDNGQPTGKMRILGQAYVWYDPKTKTVCYDNIEIPTKVLNELRHKNRDGEKFSNVLINSVVESADAIMRAMNRKGIKVNRVTTGRGYNDLRTELEDRFGAPETNPIAHHRGYVGYTDADQAQYLIRTYRETTRKYAETIRKTADKIREDLSDIKRARSKKIKEM